MLPVTNEFKHNLTVLNMIDAKITYSNVELDGNNINQIDRLFDSGLFKSIMKGLNIDVNNSIPKGTTINAQFGLYVNNAFEYVNLGSYKTHEPIRNEDTDAYTIEAYDMIEDSMIDYDLDVEYPITVRNMFIAIFNRLGWNTSGIPASFINYNKEIKQDVWSGINYTYRDCLDELCTITCQWLLEKNGIPTLTQPIATNQTIDENYCSETDVNIKKLVFFNALIFSRAEDADLIDRRDETSIEINGLHAFKVKDNQLLSTNDRSDYIDEMWNYIRAFHYYSFDIKSVGVVFLEPIDLFTLSLFGTPYNTLLLADDLEITSGIAEYLHSDEPKEEEADLKYSSDTDKTQNQTYLIVDKQNGVINEYVSKVENIAKDEGNHYQEVLDKFGGYALQSDFASLESDVQRVTTNTYTRTEINQKLTDGSVTKVMTTSGTFDENGMRYEKTNAKTSTLINEKGVEVDSTTNNEELLFAGFDENINQTIVRTENINVRKYLVIGDNSRIEDYGDGGGMFIL